MAKFYGAIGYVVDEAKDDITVEKPVERFYKGDVLKRSRRLENGEGINDNVTISNQISIVADPYAYNHIFAMRYVKYLGTAWKVTTVDVQTPRLVLSLGGVYNGEIVET